MLTRHDIEPGRRVLVGGLMLRLIRMLGLVATPFFAEAQPKAIPRVGLIGDQSSSEPRVEAFRQALRELGYVEGKNIIVEYR
jgi:putative ABC transport system substrate-binding protein